YVTDASLAGQANAVNVTGSSTIQLVGGAFTAVGLGALTVNAGGTLSVSAQAGKKVTFASTVLNGTGIVSFNDAGDLALGQVTAAAAVNVSKSGTGQLFLDNTASGAGANTYAAGTTLD